MILLRHFNIYDTEDLTMKAITTAGFTIPEQLKGYPSNAPKTKHYDQIAFIAPDLEDRLQPSEAGVFDFYEHVYRTDDEPLYAGEMSENVPPQGRWHRAHRARTYHILKDLLAHPPDVRTPADVDSLEDRLRRRVPRTESRDGVVTAARDAPRQDHLRVEGTGRVRRVGSGIGCRSR